MAVNIPYQPTLMDYVSQLGQMYVQQKNLHEERNLREEAMNKEQERWQQEHDQKKEMMEIQTQMLREEISNSRKMNELYKPIIEAQMGEKLAQIDPAYAKERAIKTAESMGASDRELRMMKEKWKTRDYINYIAQSAGAGGAMGAGVGAVAGAGVGSWATAPAGGLIGSVAGGLIGLTQLLRGGPQDKASRKSFEHFEEEKDRYMPSPDLAQLLE